ncbi:major facilitator superfamily domain-containing protein [Aspergillus varians]
MYSRRHSANSQLATEHNDYGTFPRQPKGAKVHRAEEVASNWTRQYFAIFFVFLVLALQEQISGNLMPYITSSFGQHGLLSTVFVGSSTVSAVSKLPIAKIVESWGDHSTYLTMVFLCVMGMMIIPLSPNIWIFALVKVICSVGDNSITYLIDIALIRGSSLQQRAWFLALAASPYLIASGIAPPIAERFLGKSRFLWGFTTLALATLISCVSMSSFIFRPTGSLIGIILFTLSLLVTLLPLSFLGSLSHGQVALHIAASLASSLCFCAWEYQSKSDCVFPAYLLQSRTVLLGCLTGFGLWMSFFFHDNFLSSYLQVAYGLTLTDAGYAGALYNVMSCVGALVSGLYALRYGRIKPLAVIGVLLQAISILLMFWPVRSEMAVPCVILGQVICGLSGGILMYSGQTIAMAAAKKMPAKMQHHHYGAISAESDPEIHPAAASKADEIVSLALVNLCDSIGSSIGQSLTGFIYSSLMPRLLRHYLPEDTRHQWGHIYSSIKVQLHWPIGSKTRGAISHAFVDTWWYLCAVSFTAVLSLIPCVLCWEDINLPELDRKGDES